MKLKDYPVYNYNPFRVNGDYFRSIPTQKEKVVSDTGEVLRDEKEYKVADLQSHVRIYEDMYDLLFTMSPAAVMVLANIFKQMPKNGDSVLLNVQQIASELNIGSRNTVYKGIIELMDKKVIAKCVGTDIYYINPDYVYKGSRSSWFEKYKDFDKCNNVATIKTYVNNR
jgi:hypothetical protein